MEYWAQHTVSPLDGRVGWTVVDDRYDEHVRAGEYLRVLRDGDGRSVGTARTYALAGALPDLGGSRWRGRDCRERRAAGRLRPLAGAQPVT